MKVSSFLILFVSITQISLGQQDSTRKKVVYRQNVADSTMITVQDAIYRRPFIGFGKAKTAIGGYLEANTNYFAEDGISEGFSMEMRRFNIFLYSSISKRVKFLSELEFEHGTEEIAIETAQLDFEFNPAFNFRGGIILPQIGAVNANHDSPNWEFVERPLSSTEIIPTTLSDVGFGIHGKFFKNNNIISYNVYASNGLGENITLNDENKTYIPAGKSEEMFGEDNNGLPMYNARVAFTNRKLGEIGIAYLGGVYNSFQIEGEIVDAKRRLSLFAVDFAAGMGKFQTQGEFVFANIDVPSDLSNVYGTQQYGGFIDLIYPIVDRPIFNYEKAQVLLSVRGELIDLNVGQFPELNTNIGDEVWGTAIGLSFRPTPSTIFRGNYRSHRLQDILGNPPARLGGWQFGFATYF